MATPLPKGLHHLESTVKHKFVNRFSRRVMPQKAFVQPHDRIARWNIYEGDRVRLVVGKPEDKYVDGRSREGGWKVHEVTGIDMERNRVLLKTVTYKRANPIIPDPPNIDDMPEEERQRFRAQQNYITISRPVHYSNVQLCVEEADPDADGAKSVFATRLRTARPVYDKLRRRLVAERFAASTSDGSGRREVAQPAWKVKTPEEPQSTTLDTIASNVLRHTLNLPPATSFIGDASTSDLPFPRSLRAPPSALPRAVSDAYIDAAADGVPPAEVDALMPLYLGEELSPRFSRAKATRGWNLRREQEAAEREAFVQAQVDAWHAGGKDAGLEDAMRSLGLGGEKPPRVRGRTAAEVREMAAAEYDHLLATRGKLVRQAKRVGARHDAETDRWMVRLEDTTLTRRAKRERRAAKREARLRETVLA